MSDAEKQVEVQEEAPKKRPYNLREKKDKKAAKLSFSFLLAGRKYTFAIRFELTIFPKLIGMTAVRFSNDV